jgi:hypothetical protein
MAILYFKDDTLNTEPINLHHAALVHALNHLLTKHVQERKRAFHPKKEAMAEGRYVGSKDKKRSMKCLKEAKQKQNMKA